MRLLKSEFVIDKRFLAINFDLISFLQGVLFTPKPINITTIKRLLGIRESVAEQLKNLHPHSLIYKYLTAIMVAQANACTMLQQEAFQAFIINLLSLKEEQEIVEIEVIRYKAMTQRERMEKFNELAIQAAQKLTFNQLRTPIKYFILELHKAETLRSYAPYIKDAAMAEFVLQSTERTYRRIRNNLEYFDRQRQRTDLTPAERERDDEREERYMRHLELSSAEEMQRHLSHIDRNDPVTFKQHLRSIERNEELFYKVNTGEIPLESSSYNQFTGKLALEEPTYTLEGMPLPAVEADKVRRKYKGLEDQLHDEFTKILADKDIIICGVSELCDLQKSLHNIVQGKNINEYHFQAADTAVLNYLHRLNNSRSTGCDFYVLPSLRDSKESYPDNCYIFVEENEKLFYRQNGQTKKISMDDTEKFKQSLYQALNGNKFVHLSNEQIDELIPINQGHIRYVHYADAIGVLTRWCQRNGLLERVLQERVESKKAVEISPAKLEQKEIEQQPIAEADNQIKEEATKPDKQEQIPDVNFEEKETELQPLAHVNSQDENKPTEPNELDNQATSNIQKILQASILDPGSQQAMSGLQKLEELTSSELMKSKGENFTNTFNQLVEDHPELKCLLDIYEEMTKISFLKNKIEEVSRPEEPRSDQEFGF